MFIKGGGGGGVLRRDFDLPGVRSRDDLESKNPNLSVDRFSEYRKRKTSICAEWFDRKCLVHVLAMQLLCGGNVPPHCLVHGDKV